jgi:hypothetical protein
LGKNNHVGVAAAALGKLTLKTPLASSSQVIFRPKTAKTGVLGCLMREIFACNRAAIAKMLRSARISRNKPGV